MCAICCNLDSQITALTEDFQISTNRDGLYDGVEYKRDCKIIIALGVTRQSKLTLAGPGGGGGTAPPRVFPP